MKTKEEEDDEPYNMDPRRNAYLKQLCAECGMRLGLHNGKDDRCPTSDDSEMEYRETKFRPVSAP
jgi:hypothetical protein